MADFGISELALGLAAAGAAASAGTSIIGSQAKNKAVKESQDNARKAALEQRKQIEEAAALEKFKRRRESDQIRGRLATVGAASGADPAGSYAVLDNQVTTNEAINFDIIDRNRTNQINRVASGLDAQLSELGSRRTNSILNAFTAGISGAATGLSVYNALPGSPTPTDTRTFDENDFFR